jgi:hypothetical protein
MDANDRVTVTWAELEDLGDGLAQVHPLGIRWCLAIAFQYSLPMRIREDAAAVALHGEAPWPPAISGTHRLAWAREWCADQPSATVRAYTLAGFEAMRPADRAAFLAHVASRALP